MPNQNEGRTAPENAPLHLSHDALRAELANTKRQLDELFRERHGLALPALRGDVKASARIAEIDAARAGLASKVETIEAGMVELKHRRGFENHARQLDAFTRDQFRFSDNLKAIVSNSIEGLCKHVALLLHDRQLDMATREWMAVRNNENATFTSATIAAPEAVIERMKGEHARDLCYVDDTKLRPRHHDDHEREERIKSAAALQNHMIARLVEMTTIAPPSKLIETRAQLVAALKAREPTTRRSIHSRAGYIG